MEEKYWIDGFAFGGVSANSEEKYWLDGMSLSEIGEGGVPPASIAGIIGNMPIIIE